MFKNLIIEQELDLSHVKDGEIVVIEFNYERWLKAENQLKLKDESRNKLSNT